MPHPKSQLVFGRISKTRYTNRHHAQISKNRQECKVVSLNDIFDDIEGPCS